MIPHHLARLTIVIAVVLLGGGSLIPLQAHGLMAAAHSTRSPIRVGDAVSHPGTGARPIYIGHITPLTGANASAGSFGIMRPPFFWKAGIQLAIRQINAHGGVNGRPLKLVVADDRSSTDFSGAITAFHTLVASGHITAIIGPNFSPEIQALAPSIARAGTPVNIGGQAPITTHEGNPWVFRTRVNQLIEERVLATFAARTLHLSRIAIVYNDNAAGIQARALLQVNLKRLGITPVTVEATPSRASDLTAQVLAIKKSGANGLISVLSDDTDNVLLARQMHELGVHLTWIGNPIMTDDQTRQKGGALLYGTYAATDYEAGQSPEAIVFDKLSRAVLHLPANHDSSYAYDGVQILARVMRRVGTKPQAIRRGILALRGYRGVMGTYNFDKHGDGLRQETIVQNVHGRLHVVRVVSF